MLLKVDTLNWAMADVLHAIGVSSIPCITKHLVYCYEQSWHHPGSFDNIQCEQTITCMQAQACILELLH